MKIKCATEEWSNAFIHLLMKYYKSEPVLIVSDNENDEVETLTTKVLKMFQISKNFIDKKHRIPFKNLKQYYSESDINDSYKKFIIELNELGCQEFGIQGERGLKGLIKLEPENEKI